MLVIGRESEALIDRIALMIDWLRNVINDPFGEPWPKRFTPVTPIDLTLKQVSRGLLGTRRVLLEWMQRAASAAIGGVEGIYRDTAGVAEGCGVSSRVPVTSNRHLRHKIA